MAQAIRDPHTLLQAVGLPSSLIQDGVVSDTPFKTRVPLGYVARMQRGDLHDPLLMQVLPLRQELDEVIGFGTNPVGDREAEKAPGVLHKYRGRALLTLTGACAVHCRYCFRRHFSYADSNPLGPAQEEALDYLRADRSIEEIILSGGDPLMLDDQRLARFVAQLDGIPHIKRLRVHSRLPIVLPERIDDDFLGWWNRTRLQRVMVVHVNHSQELDASVAQALGKLHDSGSTQLNQSVLLRGINDDANTLTTLSEQLFDHQVLPYYLHLLDKVQGAAHFDLPRAQAIALHQQLQQRLPGYLVPKLVEEIAGETQKTWI